MKVVIRAGGVGSRLWPISRNKKPKQFHALVGKRTMLQEAYDRCEGLVAPQDIYVSGNEQVAALIKEQLPEVAPEHIIIEPARRDTAAAIGLESVIIAAQDPTAIVASLGSDHSIKKPEEFRAVLKAAEAFIQAHPEYIIPVGLQPLRPETAYGYIQYSEKIATHDGHAVYEVEQFTEKPDSATAKEFLKDGRYLWNGNMFVWRVDTILNLYKEHMPEMYAGLMEIQAAVGTPELQNVIDRIYPTFEKVAVDYAIIEKTELIATIPAHIGWNDVGDWSRLKDELAENEKENVVVDAQHTGIDTTNALIFSDSNKTVVTIGIKNIVIVDTDDVLFIVDKYRADEVKTIVEDLEKNGHNELL